MCVKPDDINGAPDPSPGTSSSSADGTSPNTSSSSRESVIDSILLEENPVIQGILDGNPPVVGEVESGNEGPEGEERVYRGRSMNTPDNVFESTIVDLLNPFIFYRVVTMGPRQIVMWLQKEKLLKLIDRCPKCGSSVKLNNRESSLDGCSYRCNGKSKHETGVRYGSFFHAFKLPLGDVLNFIRDYVLGLSIRKCSEHINCSYGTTAIRYGLLIREIMMQFCYDTYFGDTDYMQLPGPVEVDESVFGRKTKYHKGRAVGQQIWVVGIICRTTGRVLLFPVDKRYYFIYLFIF